MALSARVPDLAALEVLLSVARTGSLGRAAQEAGISQQAVSARIRAMEAQTGVTLVRRTARGSTLTDGGAVIAQWAARVLDVASELDAEIAALRQDRRSRLKLCASLTIAERLLPAWLVSFRAAARSVDRDDVEIILTAANRPPPGLVSGLGGMRQRGWNRYSLVSEARRPCEQRGTTRDHRQRNAAAASVDRPGAAPGRDGAAGAVVHPDAVP